MFAVSDNSEENSKSNESIWKQTPLRDFGSQCIMNNHESCDDKKCKCLCHSKKNA